MSCSCTVTRAFCPMHGDGDDEHARAHGAVPSSFDIAAILDAQIEWSRATFGPGARTAGVLDHIRKELREVEAKPGDVEEWVDLVILAMDGAWRSAGVTGEEFARALIAKHAKNRARRWPDWRTAPEGQAIEHVREGE